MRAGSMAGGRVRFGGSGCRSRATPKRHPQSFRVRSRRECPARRPLCDILDAWTVQMDTIRGGHDPLDGASSGAAT